MADQRKAAGGIPLASIWKLSARLPHATRSTLEETRTAYRMGHGTHDGTGPDGEPDDSYLMSGGRWGDGSVKAFVEDHPGQSFPTERPQYE